MRLIPFLLLASSISSATVPSAYFPKLSVDDKGSGEFKKHWYSHQLAALQEPSLLKFSKVPQHEACRFLWLRTFHHPVAIRLEPKADGTSTLNVKMTSGAGGYAPGTLILNKSMVLTVEQTHAFLSRLVEADFWRAPNRLNDGAEGNDGSQWIIEGAKEGRYHVLDRWSPKSGVVHDLGVMLAFDLADLKIPKNEIY